MFLMKIFNVILRVVKLLLLFGELKIKMSQRPLNRNNDKTLKSMKVFLTFLSNSKPKTVCKKVSAWTFDTVEFGEEMSKDFLVFDLP